jgi:hypothetical protein
LLALFEPVLLYVALLVVDAELVVPVDQLYAHVVAGLAGHLVLVDEVVHLLLQRVDDEVELVALVYLLPDHVLLHLVDRHVLVQLGPQRVALVDLPLHLVLDVDQLAVFLRGLIAKDLYLVLKNLNTLL